MSKEKEEVKKKDKKEDGIKCPNCGAKMTGKRCEYCGNEGPVEEKEVVEDKEKEEVVEEKVKEEKEEKKEPEKKSNWWKIVVAIIIIIIIILLLLRSCGPGRKYKIKLHYGDEEIEVDPNFKLSDLEVDGGKVSFLVDSDGHIVAPDSKLDKDKEYSAHIIPDGKEKVKVTYKWDNKSLVVEYQKGAGLLFPVNPKKSGYVFIAWKFEDKDEYPVYMMPVNEDMTIVAVFEKSKTEGGKCTLNCDTDKDGKCDLNCDKNGDGKPDTNVDTDGDGKPDSNVDKNHDGICDLNCDIDGDGKPDTNVDTDGDGKADTNVDTDGDGKCDFNCDSDGDGKCDDKCSDGYMYTTEETQDDLNYNCKYYANYEKLEIYTFLSEDRIIYQKLDGKTLKPYAYFYENYPVYDVTEYKNSGKTLYLETKFTSKDSTGQKYYRIVHNKLIFAKDCDKFDKEITYKCEDYDKDGGFIFTSPFKKDQVEYVEVEGKEVQPKDYKDGYPLYDLSNYFEDDKSLIIEIGYNKDEVYDEVYKVKVKFPVCEFGVTEYTLTLDPNGGSVNPTSTTFIVGQVIADLPYPTRKGYQFVGWYTEKSGGQLVSEDTDTKMPEHNMTIYAHWESNDTPKQTYTLTYNANGGSVSPSSKTLNEGSTYGNLPTPTRSGYTFDGWYTKASGGNKVSSSTKISGNTTIYAHWTKQQEQQQDPAPQVDNGTISVSSSSKCAISGQRTTITATVNNALDNTVNWNVDRCLSKSGSGNSITVIPNGCGSSAQVTGTLNNGKSSSVTLTIEDTLVVTVTDCETSTPGADGLYQGVRTIKTNIPAVITSSNNAIIGGNSNSARTSVTTNASADGIVTITTPCGQTKTIRWHAVIN